MALQSKLATWDELIRQVDQWRAAGRRVVHCHGVFDLIHIGHIRYLQRARRLGDVLVVTVTPDRYVNKGPHRPVFAEGVRAEAVTALDCVDLAALNCWPTARETLRALRPSIYAKGAEFREHKTPELRQEEQVAAEVGTQVVFIDELTSSSTQLINRHLSPFAQEVEAYLVDLRERFPVDGIIEQLKSAAGLRILIVGEAIIDEYYFCSAIGQSARAPIVSTRYQSHQRFASGALGVANHLAAFCQRVTLVTMLGDKEDDEQWSRQRLRDNVDLVALRKIGAPTIVKRRYQEPYFGIPLFAVDVMDDAPLDLAQQQWLRSQLATCISNQDAVLVADYGHGMLGEAAIELLAEQAPFLAVSTQSSAANQGIHTISKYPRADFGVLGRRDLELECRSHHGSLEGMAEAVARHLGCRCFTVTLGREGCLSFADGRTVHRAPALATRVVDREGAGDAFFALSALCAIQQTPLEVLSFLGNLAAAETAAVVGNRERQSGDTLTRSIESLLR